MTRSRLTLLWAAALPLTCSGCIVHALTGTRVWTSPVTEQRSIDTTDLEALEVRTHNGSIRFAGQPGGASDAVVTITKKAGGLTHAAAEEALAAIDVFVEPVGDGTRRIGWRWNRIKHLGWNGAVTFDIEAPGSIRVDGKTHNGAIEIKGVTRDVRALTHNGSVVVSSTGGELYAKTHNGPVEVSSSVGSLHAETHNGRVEASYAGEDLTLITHNGRVIAKLAGCGSLSGHIVTHNGGVDVTLGEQTSAKLDCRTHNGAIRSDVPLTGLSKSKRRLRGTAGTGDGHLEITTHNGSVRIKDSTG